MKINAKSNLAKIRKDDECVLQNVYGSTTIYSIPLGQLILPTGEITIANPLINQAIEDASRKTFSEKVSPGSYPLIVYVEKQQDQERIGFAEIRFSNKTPIRFVQAKSFFDVKYGHRGFFGYSVSNSQTGIMDAEVYRKICNPRSGNWGSYLDYEYGDNDEPVSDFEIYSLCYNKDKSMNAVQLKIPNGRYFWYWGIANDKSICCLMGDFFTYL